MTEIMTVKGKEKIDKVKGIRRSVGRNQISVNTLVASLMIQ